MKLLIRLAFRNIFRHKMRSWATIGAIAFGVGCLIFVGGFFEDMFLKIRENSIYSQTGHIQIYKEGFREFGAADPYQFMLDAPDEMLSEINSLPGAKFLSPEIYFGGFLSNGDKSVSCFSFGLDSNRALPEKKDLAGSRIIQNSMETGQVLLEGDSISNEDPNGIELGYVLAKNFGVKVGDPLIFLNRTADGSIDGMDIHVRGLFSTGIEELDRMALKIPLKTAQKLIRTNKVHALVLYLDKTENTENFLSRLRSLSAKREWNFDIKTWKDINDFYWKTRTLFEIWSGVIKFVLAILVILIIFNTMNMVIFERTVEIGTLRALGTKRKKVVQIFISEGFFLGLTGGLMGALFGIALTLLVQKIGIPMPEAPGFSVGWVSQPLIVWKEIAIAFGLAMITSVLASFFPAFKASRLDIASALRRAG